MDTLLELVKFGEVKASMVKGAFVVKCVMDGGYAVGIHTDIEEAVKSCLESAQERFSF